MNNQHHQPKAIDHQLSKSSTMDYGISNHGLSTIDYGQKTMDHRPLTMDKTPSTMDKTTKV